MELDDLKSMWLRHDKNLSDNLKINDIFLKKANLNASRRELLKPVLYEVSSFFPFIVLIPIAVILTLEFANDHLLLVTGIVLIIALMIGLALSYDKLKNYYGIGYFTSPIVQVQAQISKFKTSVLKARKTELLLVPFVFIGFMLLVLKKIHNINIGDVPEMTIPIISIGLFVVILATIFINKYLYDEKIKNAEGLLAELEKFKNE